ncbi:MAG TPA: hypothetical protein DD729_08600 [Rhodobacteraceae bacterium]|jgi:uncharacterized membrane protein|nr:hypothetical protein [Paracoccaceae bacterium]
MEYLIWAGSGLSLIGVIGIFYCIALAIKAKRANLAEDEMGARLQRVVVLNMIALFISMVGLMMVVTGIFLG